MNITNFSTQDLERELAARKSTKDAEAIPKPLPNPDFKPVQDICARYVEELAKDGYADEDFDHWVYEAAMESVFGKNVWTWINSKL